MHLAGSMWQAVRIEIEGGVDGASNIDLLKPDE